MQGRVLLLFMRTSVVLFCLGGLALSLLITGLGMPLRTVKQPRPSTLPARTAGVRTQLEKNKADRPVREQTTLAIASDTARLLEQIQDGLNSDNPGDQAAVFTNQLLALIRSDPWAAARFAESTEAGSWHTELMRVLAQNWAQLDLPDAEKWVSQISNSDERDTMLGCICFQVAQTDPRLAIQVLEQQGLNGDRREIMLGNLTQQWAVQDLQAAVAWANNYPLNDMRDKLFMHIALAETPSAPVEAANMVAQQISPGPIQEEAAISVLQQWATQDMGAAANWVGQFPPGEVYDRSINVLNGITLSVQTASNPPDMLQTSPLAKDK
ncbi:MAG: hypothetical protein JWR19_2733 [Pedosphaera sp.]|nr:hypothetical protein [Pedosphaera sp.]